MDAPPVFFYDANITMAGILASLALPLIGKLFGGEDGIRNVPKTGVYVLHKGEVVVKKKDAMKIPKAIKMKQAKMPKATKVTKAMMKASIVKPKKN
jgi:hypothetical protein